MALGKFVQNPVGLNQGSAVATSHGSGANAVPHNLGSLISDGLGAGLPFGT